MMMRRFSRHRSRGFTLLEMILALTIFAAVMIGIMSLLQTYSERELARSTNRYMMAVMEATRATISDPTVFNAFYEAAAANVSAGTGGTYQLIADAAAPAADNLLKTFVLNTVVTGPITIQGSRVLPAEFTQNSPIRSPVRILLRIADRLPPDETDVRALEILVVTTTPGPDSIVQKTANEGGFHGGTLRTYTTKDAGTINSAFNGWRLPMNEPISRLSRTAWYAGIQNSLDSPTDGSYLVYYDYVNNADIASDYLFRTRDPSGTNRLNTMYGPLNMGGNNIIGADDVAIGSAATPAPFTADPFGGTVTPAGDPRDTLCAGSVLCVQGTGIIKGSGSVAGNMTVHGSGLVADSSSFASMNIQNDIASSTARENYGAQGLLVVDGDEDGGGGGTSDLITINNTATFDDGMTVNQGNLGAITGTAVAMPLNGVLQAATISNARKISATTINADSLTTSGQLKAGIVRSGSMNVHNAANTARTGVIDISGMQDLQYGTAGAGAQTLTVPRLRVNKLLVDNFGVCGDCPQ